MYALKFANFMLISIHALLAESDIRGIVLKR